MKIKQKLLRILPYLFIGLLATKLGQGWRLSEGATASDKLLHLTDGLGAAFQSPMPSFHPVDLCVGLICGAGVWLAVYIKGRNAKKYRKGAEYGSARWGTSADIQPFIDPDFQSNVLLTRTERLTMNSRPKNPAHARNKNVLVIGGSGSGKTRFFILPNLLQCHSSYVVTDPKADLVVKCGRLLLKKGYRVKFLNTINFSKSMHYNPFSYIHSEKDILKLVTCLIANTQGEGKGGDPFWTKAETLLFTVLIGYIHYEAPRAEQNFATLIDMLNVMDTREDDEDYQNPVDLINESVVLELVKDLLKAIAEYAKHERAEFVRVVQEAQSSQQTAEVKKQRTRLATAKQRISELEVLLCKIYEDNILGKLSDSRYATLDAQYEKEQTELTAEISTLEKAISDYEKHEKDADRFIALIDKYENFDELTITMLNEFVEKILVHAAITVVMNIAARINKVKSIVSRKEMLIFLAMILLCFGVNECFFVARVVPQNDQVLWIGSACAFAVMILVMILYERMTETVQKQKKSEMEAQAAQLLNKQQDELKSIYKNMLAEQHDLRHRVAAAEEILTATTVDDGQRSSILQLLQSDAQARLFITGSVAVDAILKAKSTVMENAGITFEFVEYPLMPLPISEQNFCMLLGNLLDNAIEGVMRLPASAPSRCIRLSFSKVWNMLFITCTNNADCSTIKRHGDEFISTKEHPELHGFGTKNMKKIVDAADGTLEYKIDQNKFTVEIMLGGAIPC